MAAAVTGSPDTARADEGEATPTLPLDPQRHALAGFPIVGGNSDIGFQFGGAATLTRFHDDVHPYLWNVDLLLSGSVKDDENGFRLVQQSHVLRLDAPDLWSGRLRLDTRGSFLRTINAGYFGIGDATTASTAPPGAGRFYQYVQEETRVRTIARVHTGTVVDVALGANLRYETPQVYGDSKLAEDVAATAPGGGAAVLGGQSAFLAGIAAGIMVDTRDSEFVTRSGIFYQLGAGATVGSEEHIAYGDVSAVLAHFAPLGGPFVFASRVVASFQFKARTVLRPRPGRYVRAAVPSRRRVRDPRRARRTLRGRREDDREHRDPRHAVSALPARSGQRMRLGTTTSSSSTPGACGVAYAATSPADGSKLDLKFGVGGGIFLQWGEAAIFRLRSPSSPDAVSENKDLLVGFYVSDGPHVPRRPLGARHLPGEAAGGA